VTDRVIFRSPDGRSRIRLMQGDHLVVVEVTMDNVLAYAVLTPADAREMATSLRRRAKYAEEEP
jgi:hypothetical protein